MNSPTTEHLLQAKSLWNLTDVPIYHRYVANYIYFGKSGNFPGHEVVLRLTGPLGKTRTQIQAELDWIRYLDECGLRVATPFRSKSGQFVETIEINEGTFHACAFQRIQGRQLIQSHDYNDFILHKWGAFLGKMHRLMKTYEVVNSNDLRPNWDQDNIFLQATQNAFEEKSELSEIFFEKVKWAQSLNKTKENFGLVHCDLHSGNFLIDNFDNFIAFDFDDGCYNWFAYDFAHIFFAFRNSVHAGKLPFSDSYAGSKLLAGYLTENNLSSEDLKTVSNFYNLRVCLIYHWFEFRRKAGDWSPSDLRKWGVILPWYLSEAKVQLDFG